MLVTTMITINPESLLCQVTRGNTHRDVWAVHHQEDTLQPPLSLLKEVIDGEGGLLPHFSFNEVKRVAFPQCHHTKVVVLSHTPIRAVIEGHPPLGTSLKVWSPYE